MNLSRILGRGSKYTAPKLTKQNAAEVKAACNDITKAGYKDVKVNTIDKNNAQIIARDGQDTYTVNMDFAKRTLEEESYSKAHVMTIIEPVKECFKFAKGTMDGTIKQLKTIIRRSSTDGKNFTETTDIQNFVSGNSYRRIKSSTGETQYFKNIDGDFVELFPKK